MQKDNLHPFDIKSSYFKKYIKTSLNDRILKELIKAESIVKSRISKGGAND